MEAEVVSAAAASVIAVGFSLALYDRWLTFGRRHVLAWLVSMLAFAGASIALWVGASFGWTVASFKLFYLLGAVLSVPPLGLGTVYLLADQKLADRLAVAVGVFGIFAAGVLAGADTGVLASSGIPNGADVFSALPRALAVLGSGVGSLVVLGGAIYSFLNLSPKKLSKKQRLAEAGREQGTGHEQGAGQEQGTGQQQGAGRRQDTNRGRLAGGTALIALGTIVLGTGGLLNSIADEMTAFALSLAFGAALLFTGFMLSTAKPAAAKPAAAKPAPAS